MLFNSYVFIFVFLPLCLILYFGFNALKLHKVAKTTLVLMSLYFYAYFNISYLPIIVSSILINYLVCFRLSNPDIRKRKIWLWIGVLFNIGLLGYFKYYDFFIENLNAVFQSSFTLKHILLPLGISFFTFQQLAFVVDSYRREIKLPNFLDYCNFVTFFPQLIAGPIVLPDEMLPQFEAPSNRHPIWKNLFDGLFIFTIGLAKKVIIADSIAVFVTAGFDGHMTQYTFAEAWLISISYTIQLYFDFSGYCDMAIGIAKMFNINLPLNFDAPYLSKNLQEFWRRWHMTLNRFLTKYLYFPLGGSRKGKLRGYLNTMVVFCVSGLWHGAGWTFITWGALHGAGVVTYKATERWRSYIPKIVAVIMTFIVVNILWVFFRAHSLSQAWLLISSMFNNINLHLTSDFTSNLPSIFQNRYNFILLVLGIVLSVTGPTAYQMMNREKHQALKCAFTAGLFICGVLLLSRVSVFLYFNF